MLQATSRRATAGARRLPSLASSSFHLSAPVRSDSSTHTSKDKEDEIEAVKARAWYLKNDTPKANEEPATTPFRQPRFTTFDPLRTLPSPLPEVVIPPLPANTPPHLLPLHTFLTSNDLFVPETVTFRRTAKSAAARTYHDPSIFPTTNSSYLASWAGKASSNAFGRGKRRRGQTDSGEGIQVEGRDVGANWDWIVVCQVAARGKGAVGRAEKSLREWVGVIASSQGVPSWTNLSSRISLCVFPRQKLFRNPPNRSPPPTTARPPKFKASGDPDSEWTLLDVGDGVCINLMTAEGRQKWDLEGAWKPV
ncbi:hypothetical protein QFC19_006790 [Naganishia cerealis]|uniref:Uncharacterized protein n=1 Tax=Naganishia cerealis TaxID=610337 RepID=A0ACC2VDE3_9TREE|nr:hypothetical protein QFC19_006790 [Naganishia cerealis]